MKHALESIDRNSKEKAANEDDTLALKLINCSSLSELP